MLLEGTKDRFRRSSHWESRQFARSRVIFQPIKNLQAHVSQLAFTFYSYFSKPFTQFTLI